MISARNRCRSVSTGCAQSKPGTRLCTISTGVTGSMPGDDNVTIPLPARWAAPVQRWAAPVIPGEPATTRTARDHLWAVGGRGRHHACTSLASTRWARAPLVSRPMSATSTSPVRPRPEPSNSPGLSAANVTVRSAARVRPRRSPVSPSTPLGRSTASTGAAPTCGASHVPLKPVPNAASITRSAGGSCGGHVATSKTRTVMPSARNRCAAARPSFPLLPLPAITLTTRP